MRGKRVALAGAVIAVVAAACGLADDAGPAPSAEGQSSQQDAATDEPPHPGPVAPEQGPYDPDAEIRPDLDLQLLAEAIDLRETRSIALRLFQYRKDGTWPPAVTELDGWAELYSEAAQGLAVLSSVSEAVQWANGLVQRIDGAD